MRAFRNLVKPYMFWMSVFIVIPMLLIVLYAFTSRGNDVLTFKFTFDNFIKFIDPIFLKVLTKSLQIAFVTTLVSIILGSPVAY